MDPAPLHIETPLLESLPLSRRVGRPVWLKLEALQPSGSFKLRGIGFACRRHAEAGCRRFVASSGGNAGLAVAYAGRRLGVPVTVVVPETTGERARALIREQGAEVLVVGASWQEAHDHAQALLGGDVAYLHPFDDPLLWEGHATLVAELVAAGLGFDTVVLSVGGGGLLCGVARGLAEAGREDVQLVTAETVGADCFARSLEAGRRIALDRIASVATSLGAKQPAEQAIAVARDFRVTPRVVSDAEALDACLAFADDHRVVVEPACGAALALAYRGDEALRGDGDIVLVVCGGTGTTHRDLVELRRKLA